MVTTTTTTRVTVTSGVPLGVRAAPGTVRATSGDARRISVTIGDASGPTVAIAVTNVRSAGVARGVPVTTTVVVVMAAVADDAEFCFLEVFVGQGVLTVHVPRLHGLPVCGCGGYPA